VELAPAVGDGLVQLVESQSQPPRFDDDVFDVGCEDAGALASGRGLGLADDGADTGADFEHSFLRQGGYDALGGVDVDLELAAECADAGEWVTGAEASGQHGFLRGEGDLLVEWDAGQQFKPERNHKCTMYLVTPNYKRRISATTGVGA
jgi:hypothetical protein